MWHDPHLPFVCHVCSITRDTLGQYKTKVMAIPCVYLATVLVRPLRQSAHLSLSLPCRRGINRLWEAWMSRWFLKSCGASSCLGICLRCSQTVTAMNRSIRPDRPPVTAKAAHIEIESAVAICAHRGSGEDGDGVACPHLDGSQSGMRGGQIVDYTMYEVRGKQAFDVLNEPEAAVVRHSMSEWQSVLLLMAAILNLFALCGAIICELSSLIVFYLGCHHILQYLSRCDCGALA